MLMRRPEGWPSQVEGTGLENRQSFTTLVGSNPTPSVAAQPKPAGAGAPFAKPRALPLKARRGSDQCCS